jgi:hypothetical protein
MPFSVKNRKKLKAGIGSIAETHTVYNVNRRQHSLLLVGGDKNKTGTSV